MACRRGGRARLRRVAETHDPARPANHEATKGLPAATGDDIVWADSLGGLWAQGKLADKAPRHALPHDAFRGGIIIVPPGYTEPSSRHRRYRDDTPRKRSR
jgi:NAD(P)H dehydrogenase (quinone)